MNLPTHPEQRNSEAAMLLADHPDIKPRQDGSKAISLEIIFYIKIISRKENVCQQSPQ
jgi:hypothetical protein